MEASLHLDFTGRRHSTSVRCTRIDPPWKVVRGFTSETGECLVHLNNVSGGIFGGDRLTLEAHLGEGAEVQVTTTGATRVYRPRAASEDAELRSSFHLDRDASLEYLPDTLIPFRDARVRQHTRFTLHEGSTLFYWEVLAPGRAASGETFAYQHVRLSSEIRVRAQPILTDRLLLEPRRSDLRGPAHFGDRRYLVTFVAVRAGSSAPELRAVEQMLAAEIQRSEADQDIPPMWGATVLPAHGVMVRGLLGSPLGIPTMLHRLWSLAKQQMSGRVAVPPRKIY